MLFKCHHDLSVFGMLDHLYLSQFKGLIIETRNCWL